MLCKHAFNSPSSATSRNALRCLANALLLKPYTRQIFVDKGYDVKACDKLKSDNRDDEFLLSRIIFLTTYDTNVDLQKLVDQHHLAENINQNLARHAKQYVTKGKKPKTELMEDMALVETLKLLFNITHFCSDRSDSFAPSIPHILHILDKYAITPSAPLSGPVGPLINALINLELSGKKESEVSAVLFPKCEQNSHVERLLEVLDLSVRAYKDDELEAQVSPLMTLLRRVYELAPKDVKQFMQSRILPSDQDREQPLGKGETLSSRLLQLSTCATTPQLREAISSLQFEMSDKDARSFVQNVGYGFASGFLFSHNVPIPENALEAWSTGSSEEGVRAGPKEPVNPITGQKLGSEQKSNEPEMTKAEKEREAERLMVLFERLKQNGIISAENPMQKMQQEGRFEELDSDDDSE